MTNTFRVKTANGNSVLFTVLGAAGCIFTARRLAMDEADRQGWQTATVKMYIC